MSASSLFFNYTSSNSDSDENFDVASHNPSPRETAQPYFAVNDVSSSAHGGRSSRRKTSFSTAPVSPSAQPLLASSHYEPAPGDRDSVCSDPDWDVTLLSSGEDDAGSENSDQSASMIQRESLARIDTDDNSVGSVCGPGQDAETIFRSEQRFTGNLQRALLAQQKALESKTATLVHHRGQGSRKRRNASLSAHDEQLSEKLAKMAG